MTDTTDVAQIVEKMADHMKDWRVEELVTALTALSAERDRQSTTIEALKAERDRQYDENVNRIAAEGEAVLKAEAAESTSARLAERVRELERERDHYRNGLQVLASTFYKEDQHQDYASHVLNSYPLKEGARANG